MARTPVGAAVSGARARARRNMDSWGKEMASATAATTARPRRRIACVRVLVRSCGERTMRTAAAAAAASHRARDWREQSHANGRRRHAEYDAQSPRDHCRPRCGRQIQLPQPIGRVLSSSPVAIVGRRRTNCKRLSHPRPCIFVCSECGRCCLCFLGDNTPRPYDTDYRKCHSFGHCSSTRVRCLIVSLIRGR